MDIGRRASALSRHFDIPTSYTHRLRSVTLDVGGAPTPRGLARTGLCRDTASWMVETSANVHVPIGIVRGGVLHESRNQGLPSHVIAGVSARSGRRRRLVTAGHVDQAGGDPIVRAQPRGLSVRLIAQSPRDACFLADERWSYRRGGAERDRDRVRLEGLRHLLPVKGMCSPAARTRQVFDLLAQCGSPGDRLCRSTVRCVSARP